VATFKIRDQAGIATAGAGSRDDPTLETERDAIVEDEASTHVNAQKIQNLHQLKAIGPEFAAVLVGEVFHRDFNNRRQQASYVGYAPSPFQSGNVADDRGISKASNRKGRTSKALC
jgi:transposase